MDFDFLNIKETGVYLKQSDHFDNLSLSVGAKDGGMYMVGFGNIHYVNVQ